MATANTPYQWSYVFDEGTRILVVDDDPILREFASVYLASPASEIETVPDAEAALDCLSRKEFDIVLVDIGLPGMDGFELVQHMRAQERLRDLPIVILTVREDIASIDRAYAIGATSFATKPVNWRLFSYQLRYVIRASKVAAAARDALDRHGGALAGAMPDAVEDDLAGLLKRIIDAANLIAGEGEHAGAARDIAVTAENLQRELPHVLRAPRLGA